MIGETVIWVIVYRDIQIANGEKTTKFTREIDFSTGLVGYAVCALISARIEDA